MSDEAYPAKPAATIVLLRDTADGPPELFMVQRATTMGFAAGAMVFPGGQVDAGDRELAEDAGLAPGFQLLDAHDRAARVAAIRETFEEAGVLISEGPAVDPALRAALRPRVAAGELPFARFLSDIGHRLRHDALTFFAHWVPAPFLKHRRYDTRFYLARLPAGEEAVHDGSESTRSHWIRAQDALTLADRGKSSIIFPTRRNLEKLALAGSSDALIERARTSNVHMAMPFVETRDGVEWLCIDAKCDYPVSAELLETALRF